MKIAWFTPFVRKSAIGTYSRIITDELSKHCFVDIWTPHSDAMHETGLDVKVISRQHDLSQQLGSYDLCIYNMGDHLDNHREIFEISRQVPGIVILHDFIMHHFFASYYFSYKHEPTEFIGEMGRWYGEAGEQAVRDSFAGTCPPVWEGDDVVKYPLFEKVVEGSLGVITHSRFLAEKVRRMASRPVSTIYFPDCFSVDPISREDDSHEGMESAGEKLLFLTVGHVNGNKRIDKMIYMLGRNPELADRIRYVIIGPHDDSPYYRSLLELVDCHNLADTVRFLGYQPDHLLYDYLRRADVIVNLRFPAMEGASWSLLEQLYMGKPVIVTDNGFYSELACEGLIRVNPFNEQQELSQAITRLCADPHLRRRMGEASLRFYQENFSTGKYCREFMSFAATVLAEKPIRGLIDTVGDELFQMGVDPDMPVIRRVAMEITNLFYSDL